MKMFKVLIVALIAASVAWAQMPEVNKPAVPCEHRGSFFSVGLGLSYMSLSKDEYVSHRSEDGDWDNPSHRYVVKSVKYVCLFEEGKISFLESKIYNKGFVSLSKNRDKSLESLLSNFKFL